MAEETYKGEFYCVKCKEKREAEGRVVETNGRRMAKGVCPVCGQGYDPGVLTCPKHGEELLPAAMQAGARAAENTVIKKICPVCGKQYSGDSQFCGGCGASLVPVN